eukprot:23787-Prorocentrum_minimum.AAC.1
MSRSDFKRFFYKICAPDHEAGVAGVAGTGSPVGRGRGLAHRACAPVGVSGSVHRRRPPDPRVQPQAGGAQAGGENIERATHFDFWFADQPQAPVGNMKGKILFDHPTGSPDGGRSRVPL